MLLTATLYDHTLDASHHAPNMRDPADAIAWAFERCRLSWNPDPRVTRARVTGLTVVASDTSNAWNIEIRAVFEDTPQRYTMAISE